MEIIGTSRILFVCILAMVNTMAICSPTGNHEIAMNNETTDPCNDFYGHVCGRWQTEHPGTSTIKLIQQKVYSEMKKLVEEWSTDKETTFSEIKRKLSIYYKSCLNNAVATTDRHDAASYDILNEIISHNGHWPITLPSNEWPIENRNSTLQTIHENYADMVDNAALFDIGVTLMTSHENGQRTNYPTITLAKFPGGRRDRYRRSAIRDTARIFMDRSMPSVNDSDVERQVTELMAFEKSLFKMEQLERSTNPAPAFKMFQIQNLWEKNIPRHSPFWMNWTEVIERSFARVNIAIHDKQYIIVEPEGLLENLGDLLNNHKERTVVNYIHWSAMVQLAPHLSQRMAEKINGFELSEKYRRCLYDGPMNDHGMFYLYVKKYFNDFEKTRKVVERKIRSIKNALEAKFYQSWIDDDTKYRLRETIDNIVTNVGYPIWYDDPQNIEEYMSDLQVDEYYLANVIHYTGFRKRQQLRELGKPFDRRRWHIQPVVPNLMWKWPEKSLTFPVVNFQKPFFDVKNPLVESPIEFGIGHEFGHVVGKNVYRFEKCTSTLNMTESCAKQKCFIDQYDSYWVATSPTTAQWIDGLETFPETFSDNIGLGLAWDVYPRKQTDSQSFFKSIAESLCEAPFTRQGDNLHPPMIIRVNGMMMNMREFSTAFECPVGSPMNPRVKCDFWSKT